MKKFICIAVAAFVAAASSVCAKADSVTDKLKTTLEQRLGNIQVKGIQKSPLAGLYEVNLGAQIVYSDAQGNYVLIGDLLNTKTQTNMTEERLAELNKIDWAKLPLADALKLVKGDGSRKMVVFSDPNCRYCKQFETTLKSIDNVTVYTFLFPVLSPDSLTKAKAVWCASDRMKAWQGWMLDQRVPSGAGDCDTTALNKNLALGRTMNVTGTPTVFLADGRRLPGAVSVDQLNKALSSVH